MALSLVQRQFGTANLLSIAYHSSSSDSFYNAESYDRMTYYGPLFTGYPTVFVDGDSAHFTGTVSGDSAVFVQMYNHERAISTPLTMSVTGRYNLATRSGWVKATITNTGSSAIANHSLRYAIVETFYQPWNGVDTCWQVCRKMLPNSNGVPLSFAPGETKADSQNFSLANCRDYRRTWIAAFVENEGTKHVSQGAWQPVTSFSGIEAGGSAESMENELGLAQNRPNPSKGSAQITFILPRLEAVRLALYDAQGRLVKTLAEGARSAGTHRVSVSGLESGVYFYRLEAGKVSLTRRMVVAK